MAYRVGQTGRYPGTTTRWEARCESGRQRCRSGRRCQAGAGPEYALAFTGRLLVTLAACAPV